MQFQAESVTRCIQRGQKEAEEFTLAESLEA